MRTDTNKHILVTSTSRCSLLLSALLGLSACAGAMANPPAGHPDPVDPGVRGGTAGAGAPLAGLTADEQAAFQDGLGEFSTPEGVDEGLGPRFNGESCAQCHAQPSAGGTSPRINPQVASATSFGARNTLPPFIMVNGPVREARFKFNPNGTRDGGVHDLFVITGRSDLPQPNQCNIQQPDFATAIANNNIIFRIPTPTFGAGLIEAIPDSAILDNKNANQAEKYRLGISGHENRSGNDGTITRFGWKAQNKSLTIFTGEAYNVEQGVTNQLFPQEREGDKRCLFNATPEDHTHPERNGALQAISDVDRFVNFMRFTAPPEPANPNDPGIQRGRRLFDAVGCATCHTPTLHTDESSVGALSGKDVNLFSDLLVHHMGSGLRDDIVQGGAGPDEFRTAPLWGVGQRIFFLHDGRTKDLLVAIRAHASDGSEANRVIGRFNDLSRDDQQAILNFLRSL